MTVVLIVGFAAMLMAAPTLLPAGTLCARCGASTVIALRGLVAAAFGLIGAFLPLILQTTRGLHPRRPDLRWGSPDCSGRWGRTCRVGIVPSGGSATRAGRESAWRSSRSAVSACSCSSPVTGPTRSPSRSGRWRAPGWDSPPTRSAPRCCNSRHPRRSAVTSRPSPVGRQHHRSRGPGTQCRRRRCRNRTHRVGAGRVRRHRRGRDCARTDRVRAGAADGS